MTAEYLILVDENDEECGKMEKLLVHKQGLLHRAFSVFVFNTRGELLLQQRADEKYHSPSLWTNTCCSHPQFGEALPTAIKRRLKEEMGMICHSEFAFSFTYKAVFENGLTEHEFDHVYFGISDGLPNPNPDEVKSWKYLGLEEIGAEMATKPQLYTEWMKICFPQVQDHYRKYY